MPFCPDRLRGLREAKGLSQEQLGEMARLHHSVITKSENGKNSPRSDALDKLAQALDCTTDYLLGRGPEYENATVAAVQMAFEVARPFLTDEQYERSRRVVRHPAAPRTAKAWVSFAEMLALAVGPQAAALALVESAKPATGRRPRRNSGTT